MATVANATRIGRGARKAGALGLLACMLASANAGAQVCATPGSAGDATIAGTVNTYWTPAAGTYSGGGTISLSAQRGAATTLSPGDLVLVIQMQCANISATDSLVYGDGAAGEPASGYTTPASGCLVGRYQFVRAGAGTSSGTLDLTGSPLAASYQQAAATATTGRRTFQVVKVPQYRNAQLAGVVTGAPWDGNSGGLAVLDVAYTLNLNGQSINVDGAGFRGGGGRARSANDAVERFRWDDDTRHAVKGEGIAGTPRFVSEKRDPGTGATAPVIDLGSGWGGYPTGTASTGDFARGAPGNAGGGGAFWDAGSDNGGGGGGGNASAGGRGGAGWRSAGYTGVLADYSNIPDKKWGFGGASFAQYGVARLVLGGGGGGGDNNANSLAVEASGAAGGGIVMVRAGELVGSGSISARGARAADNPGNDGAGGGGAGGSVLVVATTWSGALSVDARGGRGGDAFVPGTTAHGPGGGGSGGVVITSSATTAALTGGAAGNTNTAQAQPAGATHGAQSGGNGQASVIAPGSDTPGTNVGRTCKADLRITKTNTPLSGASDQADDTVVSGTTTTYSVVVTNLGPLAANGAVVRDPAGSGLGTCTLGPTACTASGSAACPVIGSGAGQLSIDNLQGAGVVIPTLPVNGAVTFSVACAVP